MDVLEGLVKKTEGLVDPFFMVSGGRVKGTRGTPVNVTFIFSGVSLICTDAFISNYLQ